MHPLYYNTQLHVTGYGLMQHTAVHIGDEPFSRGRIKASVGPGAVPNVGRLQTYNQLTGYWLHRAAVSYTHLTLPTNREV